MSEPKLVNGKWLMPKDPDDKRWYRFGFKKDLEDTAAVAVSAVAIVAGVELLVDPIIVGTDIKVKIGGMDLAPGAANFCTIRITTDTGEQIDRTMWYVREDH